MEGLDVINDPEFRYFKRLLTVDYKARVKPEYAIKKYFKDIYNTTDLEDFGKNGIPYFQNVQRKYYRIKSVDHSLQPTEEDKKMLKECQDKYKEINTENPFEYDEETNNYKLV